MFSVVQVLFGIPLLPADGQSLPPLISQAVEKHQGSLNSGFFTCFNQNTQKTLAAFGVEMGEFDAGLSFADLGQVRLVPSAEDRILFLERLKALDPSVKEALLKYGPARMFLLWGCD